MARNMSSFLGLTKELRPVGTEYKSYVAPHEFGGGFNMFDGDLEHDMATAIVTGETHYPCIFPANPPFDPEEVTTMCPNPGTLALSVIDDFSAAVMESAVGLYPPETVGERAILLPEPAYVQVHLVDCAFDIQAGTIGCNASLRTCGPDSEMSISYNVMTDFGFFFFDDPYDSITAFQSRQTRAAVTNIAETLLTGWIWRDPDANSYTGDPANEASDTLIPWAEFIASPAAILQASIEGHFARWRTGRFLVELWYEVGTVSPSPGLTCFIGQA